MSLTVRRARPDEFNEVMEFLRENGYPLEVNPADTFYAAIDQGVMVGVVRLAREFGITVLRGMRVAPSHQRRGIGTRLIRLLEEDLNGTECYCIPYAHLIEFYGQIGFRVLDTSDAPPHLSERIAGYRARGTGKEYAIMYRPPR